MCQTIDLHFLADIIFLWLFVGCSCQMLPVIPIDIQMNRGVLGNVGTRQAKNQPLYLVFSARQAEL